jgi:hypothetical protein
MSNEERKLNLRVEIKRVSDDVTTCEVWNDWSWSNAWWWSDGNAACDCNRGALFATAQGNALDTDIACGDSDYEVRLTDDAAGEVLYDEFD